MRAGARRRPVSRAARHYGKAQRCEEISSHGATSCALISSTSTADSRNAGDVSQ
jgi:hypothetical protein